nr:aconitase family protein [Leptolyngbya sp. 7M]
MLGGKIAPIFFNTAEDSGALPIECDVTQMETGDVITIYPYKGEITNASGEVISRFSLKPDTILDEVRAGGRIPLLIGRTLTDKTRGAMGLEPSPLFIRPSQPTDTGKGYTLAQKMVGKACGLPGVRPGTSCEPVMTTVGSQDTTGPMTRDELKELACLGFSADLVMQSFCHTAAYPKPVDIKTHHELPDFITARGGVSLRPGDGIIHSWLNRMLLPDTVGTGGDSHTRFPLGISFPAGSGLVAFAAALGVMPLDMPESVLVRFTGQLQPGVTLRDIVNAIPYVAIQQGLLTVEKQNKKNVFSGRIMEMEGLPDLKLEQAFELTDATAERSCAGCTIKLSSDTVAEYLRSNVALLKNMVARGYGDARTILRRVAKMEQWLANPSAAFESLICTTARCSSPQIVSKDSSTALAAARGPMSYPAACAWHVSKQKPTRWGSPVASTILARSSASSSNRPPSVDPAPTVFSRHKTTGAPRVSLNSRR